MNLIEQVTLGSRDVSAMVRKRLLGKDIGEADARDVLQALQGLLDEVKERMLSGPVDDQFLMTVAAKIEGLKNALGGETPVWSGQKDNNDNDKPSSEAGSQSPDEDESEEAEARKMKAAGLLYRRKMEDEDSAAAKIIKEMRAARKRQGIH